MSTKAKAKKHNTRPVLRSDKKGTKGDTTRTQLTKRLGTLQWAGHHDELEEGRRRQGSSGMVREGGRVYIEKSPYSSPYRQPVES